MILKSAVEIKVPVIKVIRTLTDLGLKEARMMVDLAPSAIIQPPYATPEERKAALAMMQDAGATVMWGFVVDGAVEGVGAVYTEHTVNK